MTLSAASAIRPAPRIPPHIAGVFDLLENHYTGKERDTESGNDYFLARYYNSSTGRFLSPDWSVKIMPVPYAKLDNPQSLNLYAYVGNNPLSRTDPTGHYVDKCASGDKTCEKGIDEFEKQRQKDLKSKDSTVRGAAAAWGDRGVDNHVNVTFKTQAEVDEDAGNAPGVHSDATTRGLATVSDHTPIVNAEFVKGTGGSDLAQTIAHEGSHVEDDLQFLNSYNSATGMYSAAANRSLADTEFKAYETGMGVKQYSQFPSGPGGYQQVTDYINTHYTNPSSLVFKPEIFPQQ